MSIETLPTPARGAAPVPAPANVNKPTFPFQEIQGAPLNGEQRSYLEGLFAGMRDRGLLFTDVEPNPAAAPSALTLPENLIAEERIKRELHPLDAYQNLLEFAAANRPPDKEEIFRFKWNGLFYLSPNKEAFMARLRIPGGQLKTFQLRELARVADELTTGYVQITTRANFQIRLIQPKDGPEVLRRIQSVGLHTRGAGADNIRNITANPTAGVDPTELIDTMPLAHQLGQMILNDRVYYDLPRKFNVAFDGGGLIGSVEDTNDIGLKAVKVDDVEGIAPGVYFRVKLGGATGHKAFAQDLGVLVAPELVLKVTAALIRVYIANGNRGDRKKARLKHLLESWSLAQYLAETEKLLGFKLLRAGPEIGKFTDSELPHTHVGVYPQKQKGLNYFGVAIPVGQITPKQMLRVADLADLYGSGEVRLTVWQNLVIPNVPDAMVETLKKALVKMGFDWKQSNLRSGVIACTGNSYCKFASANTKGHALELATYLEKRFELDRPINIHLTGCPNSCAQHYMGDIGLLGAKVKVAGESVEGYHVFVGGGFGATQAIGRQVFQGVSFESLKPTLAKMIQGYQRHRAPGETFQAFTKRYDLNTLQAIFSNDE
jgi:ferredoxin-nitrite reductase